MSGGPPGVSGDPPSVVPDPADGGVVNSTQESDYAIAAARDQFVTMFGPAQAERNALEAQRAFQDQMALAQHLTGGASAINFGPLGRILFMGGSQDPRLMWPTQPLRSDEEIRQEQAALDRAYTLLEETIGKQEAARVDAGGAYLIPSKLWSSTTYGVAKNGRVLIFGHTWLGRQKLVAESCITVTAGNLPWPDVVLAKIKAIETDETIVFATGNVSSR